MYAGLENVCVGYCGHYSVVCCCKRDSVNEVLSQAHLQVTVSALMQENQTIFTHPYFLAILIPSDRPNNMLIFQKTDLNSF